MDEIINSAVRRFSLGEEFDVFDYIDSERIKVEENIDRLIDLLKVYDSYDLLTNMRLGSTIAGTAYNVTHRNDAMHLPSRLEQYLCGMILVHGCVGGTHNYEDVLKTASLIGDSLTYSHMKGGDDYNCDEDGVEFHSIQREVTASRFAFTPQYRTAARRAYRSYDPHLKRINGFTIDDAVIISDIVVKIVQSKVRNVLEKSKIGEDDLDINEDAVTEMEQSIEQDQPLILMADSDLFNHGIELAKSAYESTSDCRNSVWFTKNELMSGVRKYAEQSPRSEKELIKIAENFLERMSAAIGDRDTLFHDAPSNDFQKPGEYNPFDKYPIIHSPSEDEYILISDRYLWMALRKTFYYDLISDEQVGDETGESGGEFGEKFGEFVEDWSYIRFSNVFDSDNIYLNPELPKSGEEATDILIEWDNHLIVVECKASTLSSDVQVEDFETIKSDINGKAEEGYQQSLELIERLPSYNGEPLTKEGGNKRCIDYLSCSGEKLFLSDFDHIISLVVVGDTLDTFATTDVPSIFEINSIMPYVIDTYNLQILSTIVDDPKYFIQYINERRSHLRNQNLISSDERDYIGLYLKENYSFPDLSNENQVVQIQDAIPIVKAALNLK